MKRIVKFVGLGTVVAGIGIQFVPVKEIGTNPPERFTIDAARLSGSDKAQLKSYFLRNAKEPEVARPATFQKGNSNRSP